MKPKEFISVVLSFRENLSNHLMGSESKRFSSNHYFSNGKMNFKGIIKSGKYFVNSYIIDFCNHCTTPLTNVFAY